MPSVLNIIIQQYIPSSATKEFYRCDQRISMPLPCPGTWLQLHIYMRSEHTVAAFRMASYSISSALHYFEQGPYQLDFHLRKSAWALCWFKEGLASNFWRKYGEYLISSQAHLVKPFKGYIFELCPLMLLWGNGKLGKLYPVCVYMLHGCVSVYINVYRCVCVCLHACLCAGTCACVCVVGRCTPYLWESHRKPSAAAAVRWPRPAGSATYWGEKVSWPRCSSQVLVSLVGAAGSRGGKPVREGRGDVRYNEAEASKMTTFTWLFSIL